MQKAEQQSDLDLKGLSGFYCSENYYNVLGVNVTDGVKYLMDNGYSWFVTDSLAAILFDRKLKAEEFLVVKLTLTGDHKAEVTIDDGGKGKDPVILYRQAYDYTDAKRNLKLYFENAVLCLASER
jgi:hypothetical protein